MYASGSATETAALVEIDAIIDPRDTSKVVLSALLSANGKDRHGDRRYVDVW
jgi:hypothetical protein